MRRTSERTINAPSDRMVQRSLDKDVDALKAYRER